LQWAFAAADPATAKAYTGMAGEILVTYIINMSDFEF